MKICNFLLAIGIMLSLSGCGQNAVSASGINIASVKIEAGSDGLTTEQRNISERLKIDNAPGSIKHLYVLSAYSGQAIIYSTVRGKVTSSGKRLTPLSVSDSGDHLSNAFKVRIGNQEHYTTEVLQDDGTYGSSVEYLYWWDTKGVYHQHYMSGGQILHISDQPVAIKGVILNMEITGAEPKVEAK